MNIFEQDFILDNIYKKIYFFYPFYLISLYFKPLPQQMENKNNGDSQQRQYDRKLGSFSPPLDIKQTPQPTRNFVLNPSMIRQSNSSSGTKNQQIQHILQSGKQQIIIVSPAGSGGGQQNVPPSGSGGQAISLSGLSAQQLAQILQAYGVLGGKEQKTENNNIIVVNNNQNTQQVTQTQLGNSLQQQIQQLQSQNQMMQQQILANASQNMQSSRLINSPLSQYIIDNDLLLQNLTQQLQQHQRQIIQQQQIFQINSLLKQFPQKQDRSFNNIEGGIQSTGVSRSFDPSHVNIRVTNNRNQSATGKKKDSTKYVHSAKKPRDMAPVLQNKELIEQQNLTRQKSQNKGVRQDKKSFSSATQRQKEQFNSGTKSGPPGSAGNPDEKKKVKKGRKGSKLPIEEKEIPKPPSKEEKKEVKKPSQPEIQLPPQPPQPSAKEKKRIKLEKEKEREKELFEKNFNPADLMISRMGLNIQRSFIVRPNAIIVYNQNRLVKLDITSNSYQPSAVPQSVVPPPLAPQKPLLITPEQLHDFYNHSSVKYFANVGRALEVYEEPQFIFAHDQDTVDPKSHSIQERKIREVLDKQLEQKFNAQKPENLARQPIVFPSGNIKETTIFFNSRFESGNLREVEKLNEFEYNCYVNFDFNSTTHSQWYYFSVRNIGKGRQYKFNIMNMQKDESCYQIGMKPFVYSTKKNRENGTNLWKRGCENVCYYKNKLRTKVRECAPDYEFDEDNIPCYEYEDEASQMVTLNTLSFCYEFEIENDITYFAYFQPYTLSDLEDYLFLINKKYEPEHLQNIYKCEKLCNTVGGKPCYVLTITDNVKEDDIDIQKIEEEPPKSNRENEEEETASHILSGFQMMARDKKDFDPSDSRKQTIFLSARVHPGESNASFMIQGAIDFLLQKNNKEAKVLRETFIFKIIPMLNPDGVVNGNYRCNYVGADLNRRWPNPSKLLHPTIYYTKKLLKMCHQDNQVLLFCDFHGHTRKRNVFMYGCVSPQTEINQHKNNNLIRIVPYLLDQKNKLFSFADCKFANEKEKESTGRLVMFKEFGILNSYTIESTFYSHYHPRMGQRKKVNVEDEFQIKVEELVEIGNDFCETVMAIINSKILKRKFIIDTTTPLGSQTAGQGGNPLTQFLINQQNEQNQAKHLQNTQTYNQQNNVQSVIKSFIDKPNQLQQLMNMPVSSLDNSMSSPTKKKQKKQEAKSQQIPKDFLEGQEEISRNSKFNINTQNDESIKSKDLNISQNLANKKIKLLNKQSTPINLKNKLLEPANMSVSYAKTPFKTKPDIGNLDVSITLKHEQDNTPCFTDNFQNFTSAQKDDNYQLRAAEYDKRKQSDVSLVVMTEDASPEDVNNISYSATEPQSSSKLNYDNEYQIFNSGKKGISSNFFTSGPPSNQKFKTPHIGSREQKMPMVMPAPLHSNFLSGQPMIRQQKSKSSLSLTGSNGSQVIKNMSSAIKFLNGNNVVQANQTQKIKQNNLKLNEPQVQNFCNEQGQLLEIQQRILQQRKQQAELQVQQISTNIMNARQSYQAEKRKFNDKPGNSSMGITQLPRINQSGIQIERPVSQQKKDNHRNITVSQFAYVKPEAEVVTIPKNSIIMKGAQKSSYTVMGANKPNENLQTSFDKRVEDSGGSISAKPNRSYVANFDLVKNDTQMEGGQKSSHSQGQQVKLQFNFNINMP